MYHSPAHVLLQHCHDLGITTSVATDEWAGFVGWTPDDNDTHDNTISISDTGGVSDGRIHRTGQTIEHPGVQIVVRARTYETGHRKAVSVASALDAIVRQAVTIEGHTYSIQSASKRPTLNLGRESDARQRYRFAINAILTVEETV